ncbi:cupin domain-containing protein [Denitromonas iodatirespirans]|uniref:Cupin domain-containing protein n=1 Tax=Denitromonas iodatirespirans TaxID=2795389 RepID=A0A944D4U9_DENI1|nr:cupin domain-containing protein [Denitromonas iodatirespirans]MBT0960030.1 cupin domain-containing protein [Denitromonas iodatirespirans]
MHAPLDRHGARSAEGAFSLGSSSGGRTSFRSRRCLVWSAGERFVPHRHWGGEEVFVLHGEFTDEHGRSPVGTWLRSPHLSAHHPFAHVRYRVGALQLRR